MADKDFRAIIKAQLDTSGIPNQIQRDIEDRTITLNNINFNRTNLINQIQSALDAHPFNLNFANLNLNQNNLNQQSRNAGRNFGQQFIDSFNVISQSINVQFIN